MRWHATALLTASATSLAADAPDPALSALETEIGRAMTGYAAMADPPYFLGYRLTDYHIIDLAAEDGALARDEDERGRVLQVEARVGSPALDSTHTLREDYAFDTLRWRWLSAPLDGDPLALRTAVWHATTDEIQEAQERIVHIRGNKQVKVEEADASPDFAMESPHQWLGDPADVSVDRARWEPLLRELSRRLAADPRIESSGAALHASATTTRIAASDGARIRQPRVRVRVSLEAGATADDGMQVGLYRWRDVRDEARLPSVETLNAWADDLVADVRALRDAPLGEPYTGPVLLRGPAAGVFVHEVLGHRVEGHRQKDEDEGQTFRNQVGQRILPEFIDIVDDPTLGEYAGYDLNGHYAYDEEGQPAQRAVLVDDGIFRGFLMGRSPIAGFEHSNGHGRAASSSRPVARMANTLVETTRPLPYDQLRKMLVDEAKKQGKSYGLIVEELSGGFTLTGRVFPNTFNVRAETVWRAYVDGRPDELVRGLDLVGTPLVALSKVVATGDDPGVFNGYCGAESGMVPNSAISPSLLVSQLEVQRKEKEQDRPPLLPRPEAP